MTACKNLTNRSGWEDYKNTNFKKLVLIIMGISFPNFYFYKLKCKKMLLSTYKKQKDKIRIIILKFHLSFIVMCFWSRFIYFEVQK